MLIVIETWMCAIECMYVCSVNCEVIAQIVWEKQKRNTRTHAQIQQMLIKYFFMIINRRSRNSIESVLFEKDISILVFGLSFSFLLLVFFISEFSCVNHRSLKFILKCSFCAVVFFVWLERQKNNMYEMNGTEEWNEKPILVLVWMCMFR